MDSADIVQVYKELQEAAEKAVATANSTPMPKESPHFKRISEAIDAFNGADHPVELEEARAMLQELLDSEKEVVVFAEERALCQAAETAFIELHNSLLFLPRTSPFYMRLMDAIADYRGALIVNIDQARDLKQRLTASTEEVGMARPDLELFDSSLKAATQLFNDYAKREVRPQVLLDLQTAIRSNLESPCATVEKLREQRTLLDQLCTTVEEQYLMLTGNTKTSEKTKATESDSNNASSQPSQPSEVEEPSAVSASRKVKQAGTKPTQRRAVYTEDDEEQPARAAGQTPAPTQASAAQAPAAQTPAAQTPAAQTPAAQAQAQHPQVEQAKAPNVAGKFLDPESNKFPLEDLQVIGRVRNIDNAKRELYLEGDVFEATFSLTFDEFMRLPLWRRNRLKKQVKLF